MELVAVMSEDIPQVANDGSPLADHRVLVQLLFPEQLLCREQLLAGNWWMYRLDTATPPLS